MHISAPPRETVHFDHPPLEETSDPGAALHTGSSLSNKRAGADPASGSNAPKRARPAEVVPAARPGSGSAAAAMPARRPMPLAPAIPSTALPDVDTLPAFLVIREEPVTLNNVAPDAGAAEAHRQRGAAALMQGDWHGALQAFDLTLRVDYKHSKALWGRAIALQKLKRFDEALATTDEVEAAVPASWSARAISAIKSRNHLMRADIYLESGRPMRARAAAIKAVELDQTFSVAHFHLGRALLAIGHDGEAIAAFDKAIELKFDSSVLRSMRATALNNQGRATQALADASAAVSLDRKNLDGYFQRALAFKGLQQNPEALAAFDEVLAMHPDHAQAHRHQGDVQSRSNNFSGALESFRKAIAADSRCFAAYVGKAGVLHRLGRNHDALLEIERASLLNPGAPVTHEAKAAVLSALAKESRDREAELKRLAIGEEKRANAYESMAQLAEGEARRLRNANPPAGQAAASPAGDQASS